MVKSMLVTVCRKWEKALEVLESGNYLYFPADTSAWAGHLFLSSSKATRPCRVGSGQNRIYQQKRAVPSGEGSLVRKKAEVVERRIHLGMYRRMNES